MAELMIGPIIGPLVSLVKEKASSYLLEQYEVMEGMEEQHEILMRKLPAILDIITDAEEQAAHRAGAKAWLEALKKVAYEANDAFDEFKYEALQRKARKDGHYGKLGVVDAVKLFPSHNRIAFRDRMGNKLRKIVQSIEVLVAEMNAFGFRYHPQPDVSKQWRQTDPNIFDPAKIAERSRGKDNQKVVDILLGQANNVDLVVFPIVGMGGLGKTTLAQLIYNDPQVQKHFQLRLWVCVSDNFDVDSLAKSIVEAAPTKEKDDIPQKKEKDSLAKSTSEAAATNDKDASKSPLDRLQKVVSAQRFLLVLDDVWKTGITFSDKWEKLKDRLQHGANGSAVLTTTRDKGVARAMGTIEAYNLTALEKSFLEEIIKTRAFREQKEKPELVEMVGEIVERCVGSPLAATALGSVLRTKTSVEEWRAVLRKSTICDEETGILPILKLSYDDLPSHMKQCFAFCAVFPKDYEIDVDKMIQIWMSNGFIPAQNEVRPETIGKGIFNELASRSFFQDVTQVPVDKYKSIHGCLSRITCKIHDLMHDVAQSVMQKECVTIAEEPSQTELFPSVARHLFLPIKHPHTFLNDSLKKTSPAIQTLLCEMGVDGPLQHPSKYSSVRALRLRQYGSTFLLKPKHLHHLRYLDLSDSAIKALPEDISILYNLQTLNLSGCHRLRRLPWQMKYMNALRHLNTDRCVKLKCMPPDLRRLTSLQTLTHFVVGIGSDCSNLGELQHLNLCGRLVLRQLENVTEADAKVANLGNKEGLTELTLSWSKPLEEEGRYDTVLQGLNSHCGLQVLTLDGYQGTTFLTSMGMLQNVLELYLCRCKKLQKLPPLWQLSELRLLTLRGLEKLKFLCSGDTSFTFPKLKELELVFLPDFKRWCEIDGRQGDQIMFPQLEKLSIVSCNKLTALPEAPLLRGDHTSFNSAFPELKVIELRFLDSLKSWGVTEGTDGEQPTCPNPLSIMVLQSCNFFFRSSALALWKCFVQLQDLKIRRCDGLVHWPEKEFQSLVSLRTLTIYYCKELTGYAQPPDQSAPQRSQLLPCLQSLYIDGCESLVEVFDVAASLKTMRISFCPKLELKFQKRVASLGRIDQVEEQEESAVIQPGTDIMPSTAVPKLSPSAKELFLPCLESLSLQRCDSISELLNLPWTLTGIGIYGCPNIEILSGQLDALQHLVIRGCDKLRSLESCSGELPSLKSLTIIGCRCLAAIPNGPEAYTSLQSLTIYSCPRIKSLPRCLQQRLAGIERKKIDSRFEGHLLFWTRHYAAKPGRMGTTASSASWMRMGNKLRKIVQSIEVLVAEMNAFGFTYHPQPQVSKQWRQTDPHTFDPTKIAERSRGKDNQKVVDILLGQANNVDLTVVPIVGMGGLGKTTLAQLVYNDPQVQKHFQLRLWVCVSDNFDVDSLARSIVEAAATNEKDDIAQKKEKDSLAKRTVEAATTNNKDANKSPLDRLQNVVSAQRYLLVLDDVWKTGITFPDKWEKLKARLQYGGIGSAVLTTTRDGGVAQAMGTVEAYNLTALEKSYLEEIIKTRAFSVQEEKPELVQMVGEIAERCVGSPLAATALGSVLRTKTSVEEWRAVLRKSTICDEETGILPILKLSYDDLPSHMKQCFAFCAVFPKDYEIDVDKMIQIWMANGFVPAQKEVRPETSGKRIFNELASRSFFQDVKQVPVDKVKSIHGYCSRITCKIHDLMHDVAQSVLQKECVTIAEEPSQTELFPSTARHLFLPIKRPHTLLNDSLKKTSPTIQTLLCGEAQIHGSLRHPSKYSSVRALRLNQYRKTFLLKPKHLHHLRYLDLSDSGIKALPEDLSILYNLQTLNLSGCDRLRRLPRQMKYMNALRHLNTNGCVKLKCMPPNLRQFTSLQTLTRFVVGTGSDCSNLGELQHLNLCGVLELTQLENVTEADANLGNKEGLTELTLSWSKPLEEEGRYDTVLQGLKSHSGLKVLTLDGYQGTTFLTSMGMLQNVLELCLCRCKKLQKLPPLWQLSELRLLTLRELEKLKFLCSGDTSFTFPKLKELELQFLPDFERWCEIDGGQGDQIMFPQLERLSIDSCEKLTALPEAPLLRGELNSAFPELKVIRLHDLNSLKSWRVTEGTDGEQPTFPNPLSIMELEGCNFFFRSSALALWKCFVQLQDLKIRRCDGLVHWPEKEFQSLVSLRTLTIRECKKLTGYTQPPDQSASERSQLLPRLQSLAIMGCESLVEVFDVAESLKTMDIWNCPKLEFKFRKQEELVVIQQPGTDIMPSTAIPKLSPSATELFLPSLEHLDLWGCDRISEPLNLPSTLTRISICKCRNIEILSGQLDALQYLGISYCDRLRSLESCSGELPSLKSL